MTAVEIANLIPDRPSREAWVRAGMPTDLGQVALICTTARQGVVSRGQAHPRFDRASYRKSVSLVS